MRTVEKTETSTPSTVGWLVAPSAVRSLFLVWANISEMKNNARGTKHQNSITFSIVLTLISCTVF